MNTYETAKAFLNSEKDTWNNKDNIQELHRRINVFNDALGDFSALHETFKDAYQSTPHKIISLNTYKKKGAKGYIGTILFQNNEQHIQDINEYKEIKEEINHLFTSDLSDPLRQIKEEIKNKLFNMLSIGYPEYNIQEKGLRYDCKDIERIFTIIKNIGNPQFVLMNQEIKHNKTIDDLLFQINYITCKYLDVAHYLYDSYNNILQEEFINKLSDLRLILGQIKAINDEENKIFAYIMKGYHTGIVDITWITSLQTQLESIYQKYSLKYTIFDEMRDVSTIHEIRGDSVSYNINNIYLDAGFLTQLVKQFNDIYATYIIENKIGYADHELIGHNKSLYGAKGSYLQELINFVNKFHEYRIATREGDRKGTGICIDINVPSFENIDIKQYEYWKQNGTIDDVYFKELYGRWKSKGNIIIRSSALYSEDNSTSTGAGIYESIKITNPSYEEFTNVVTNIYQSCESPRAKQYRENQKIGQEEMMGIVIQEYIKGDDYGHANSVISGRPELMELSYASGARPIVNKSILEDTMFGDDEWDYINILHYTLDSTKYDRDSITRSIIRNNRDIAIIIQLLEKYFGSPIQVEFLIENTPNLNGYGDRIIIHLVQVRPLPLSYTQKQKNIIFPTDESLWQGRALGICDQELEVLVTGEDNRDKIGIVSFTSNIYGSLDRFFIERSIPKHGVVIIHQEAGYDGHIETLCAEKGIVCLFKKTNRTSWQSNDMGGINNIAILYRMGFEVKEENIHPFKRRYTDFLGYKKVRVVANGLEGRVYSIND